MLHREKEEEGGGIDLEEDNWHEVGKEHVRG